MKKLENFVERHVCEKMFKKYLCISSSKKRMTTKTIWFLQKMYIFKKKLAILSNYLVRNSQLAVYKNKKIRVYHTCTKNCINFKNKSYKIV